MALGSSCSSAAKARNVALLALSVFVAAANLAPSVAQAQASAPVTATGLPDFTNLVERVESGVVNIRTTAKAPSRNGATDDPFELFRWFFGPDFRGVPGGPPSGSRDPRGDFPGDDSDSEVPRGVGSGFFISTDGYIVTNHHVVDDATDIYVTLPDKREFKAKVIGSDQRTDVALIKIDLNNTPKLPIGDPSRLRKGEWVVAIGSPFGLESTVTAGIVSAKGRDTGDYLPFIQTDVAVNPGNSGGPLLNMRGEVVGVNSQIISRNGGFMGISLSIPIDDAMRVVEQLRTGGRVSRGRIGVQIGEVTKEIAEAIGLGRASGALIRLVEEGSPAEKAGIEAGDVLLKFDNVTIDRYTDLPRTVGNARPGAKVTVKVWRKGTTRDLLLTVAEMEPDKVANAKPEKSETQQAANSFGLNVVELTPAQRRQLKIRGGVRIESVEGISARAGMRPGDVVMAVNNVDVTSVTQFNSVLAKLDRNRPHGFLVRRGESSQWIPVKAAGTKPSVNK